MFWRHQRESLLRVVVRQLNLCYTSLLYRVWSYQEGEKEGGTLPLIIAIKERAVLVLNNQQLKRSGLDYLQLPHIRKLIYTPHISMVCCRCKKGLCSGVCVPRGAHPVQIVAAQDAQTRLVSLHVIIVNTQCCVCACSAGPTRVVITQNYTLILWYMVYSGL